MPKHLIQESSQVLPEFTPDAQRMHSDLTIEPSTEMLT